LSAPEEFIMTPTLQSFHPVAARRVDRAALARVIRAAAAMLHALAERVAPKERGATVAATAPRLEFHSEAGAPEGALYVDGVLFGHLPGVRRL
jgi:hypothetical protein